MYGIAPVRYEPESRDKRYKSCWMELFSQRRLTTVLGCNLIFETFWEGYCIPRTVLSHSGLKSPVQCRPHLHFTCIYVQDVPEPQMRVWIVDVQSTISFDQDVIEIINIQQWYDPNGWFAP
jgi:hypothetical protein